MKNNRMKINFYYFLILFFIANLSICQNTFLKTYGMPGEKLDKGYAVLEADDGGYVAVGETGYYSTYDYPTVYHGNIFLIKTNIYGDTLWTKTYGNDENDRAFSIDKTDDGGYIIAGFDGFSTRGDNSALWLIKTNSFGDSIWTKKYDLNEGKSICKTADGGYVITGRTFQDSIYNTDVYLLKIDSSGDIQWLKSYNKASEDEGLSVQQTNDNGFIISAMVNYETSGDIWLVKTDSVGDTIWTKMYTSEYLTIGYSVCQTTDGGYFVAGTNTELKGELESNIYLLKTDSAGDTIWTKTISKSYSDIAFSGIQTIDGGYIVVGKTITNGTSNSNIYIVKLDYVGNVLWANEIGNQNDCDFSGRDIAETKDVGFIITGLKAFENFHYVDLCLLKVNSEGILTSLKNNTMLPQDFLLHQNYPNPFNPTTKIKFSVPSTSIINISVYNILGERIRTLLNREFTTGSFEVVWNGKNNNNIRMASGIYFIRMEAENFLQSIKAILIK
jgi:hypothetical protein